MLHRRDINGPTNEQLFNQSDHDYRLQDSDFKNGLSNRTAGHRRIMT